MHSGSLVKYAAMKRAMHWTTLTAASGCTFLVNPNSQGDFSESKKQSKQTTSWVSTNHKKVKLLETTPILRPIQCHNEVQTNQKTLQAPPPKPPLQTQAHPESHPSAFQLGEGLQALAQAQLELLQTTPLLSNSAGGILVVWCEHSCLSMQGLKPQSEH